jgi:NAD(P)-dependent dehydrogenase (short-subunit alcohol dehydrogenase family)
MQILLTGGSGSVGKAIIERLVQRGYGVRVIGRRSGLAFEGAEYRVCDVNDYPALREAVRGCTAVVHLAAIANPGYGTPEEIFRINCSGSFNVFQAAAEEGIRRVVQASSINATGQFFGLKPAPLHYLPIDEVHPVFSTDAYSFSKNVIESIGQFFWHREGISSLALRLPWVAPAEVHSGLSQWREGIKSFCTKLSSRPLTERRAWFKQAWDEYNLFRAGRPYEPPKAQETWENEDYPDNSNPSLMAMSQRVNFFTMLDERDSAQSVEKGLTAEFEGAHTLFINDKLNWAGVDSAVLADLFYPDVPIHKKPLIGTETLVSIDKARQLIGFEPEYTFGG